jgi:hypothetical protein
MTTASPAVPCAVRPVVSEWPAGARAGPDDREQGWIMGKFAASGKF